MEKDNLEQILRDFGFSKSEQYIPHGYSQAYETPTHRLEYFTPDDQFTLYKNIDGVYDDLITAKITNEQDFITILNIYLHA